MLAVPLVAPAVPAAAAGVGTATGTVVTIFTGAAAAAAAGTAGLVCAQGRKNQRYAEARETAFDTQKALHEARAALSGLPFNNDHAVGTKAALEIELSSDCAGDVVAENSEAIVAALPEQITIPHLARVFLRERTSQRYLTVADSEVSSALCVMTEKAVSLFICHHVECRWHRLWNVVPDLDNRDVTLAFEHEGVPAPGSFLAGSWHWWASKVDGQKLSCRGRSCGMWGRFRLLPDLTLQHVASGKFLYVDPSAPGEITVSTTERSSWDFEPTL